MLKVSWVKEVEMENRENKKTDREKKYNYNYKHIGHNIHNTYINNTAKHNIA